MTPEQLVQHALEARQRAYAPYSNYLVGAAVLAAALAGWRSARIEPSEGLREI